MPHFVSRHVKLVLLEIVMRSVIYIVFLDTSYCGGGVRSDASTPCTVCRRIGRYCTVYKTRHTLSIYVCDTKNPSVFSEYLAIKDGENT
jgi:hypothetical protein